jgi:hypothetical protein
MALIDSTDFDCLPLLQLPMVVFHRIQIALSDEESNTWKTKIRQVYCIPMRIIALEHMFFSNILEITKLTNLTSDEPVYTSGMSTPVVGRTCVRRLIRMLVKNNNNSFLKWLLWSLDHRKYDKNTPNEAIDVYFAINEYSLEFHSSAHKHIYNLLRMYLKYAPFVVNDMIYFMNRGIPSGSYITNHFGTWWHLTLWHITYILLGSEFGEEISAKFKSVLEVHFPKEQMFVREPINNVVLCGDDALAMATQAIINLFIGVCNSFMHHVTYKQPISHGKVFFLGKYWLSDSSPYQSFEYMTAHIIFRTKYYKEEELPFGLDYLNLNRILSICLEFSNGLRYLEEVFYDWKPYVDYKTNRFTTYLMKDWQDDGFVPMSYSDQLGRSCSG